MRWFLERAGPVPRFAQSVWMRIPAGLKGEAFVAALQAILDRHDVLRLRLVWSAADDEWLVDIGPPGDRGR